MRVYDKGNFIFHHDGVFLVSFGATFCLKFFWKRSSLKCPVKVKEQRSEIKNAPCISSRASVQLFGKNCTKFHFKAQMLLL